MQMHVEEIIFFNLVVQPFHRRMTSHASAHVSTTAMESQAPGADLVFRFQVLGTSANIVPKLAFTHAHHPAKHMKSATKQYLLIVIYNSFCTSVNFPAD
jgi:hypothetical protein